LTDLRPSARLALLVRDRPYSRRAARTDLDTALAAAAMDIEIELYFLGAAVLQLADRRDPAPALLPPGYRGWSALPELAEVQAFAEQEWLQRCERDGINLLLPLQGLDAAAMAERWRACRHALLL
jgi:sulfur relay (sulfurtransferase) DsrF/TusC family protein